MQATIILERKLPGLQERALREFVVKACQAAGLPGAVTVLVTGDSAMRRLNARFRGKKTATDVLSFPAVACPKRLAGDIAVSADIALRNARRLGHSPSAEVRILILHGILHLAGYDHQANHGEMARRERRLRGRLALPGGLIERSSRRAARSRP